MIAPQESECRTFYRGWWQLLAGLLGCQWKLVASQYQTGLKLTEAVLRIPVNKEASPEEKVEAMPQRSDELRKLECRAAERVKQGFAPPKEIYEIPYRDRIDWFRFPEWARPSDPEVFEGCGHEG
jgi:hypothetical protein